MSTRTTPAAPRSRIVSICGTFALLALAHSAAPAGLLAQTVPSEGQVSAQSQGHATLEGRVLAAADGKPLVLVTVELPELKRSTVTDAQGRFRFDRVPAGEHGLRARLVGFRPQSRPVSTEGGAAVEVRLVEDPVLLSGLTVTTNRFDTRLRAVPFAIAVHGKGDVYATAATDAEQFIRLAAGIFEAPCPVRDARTITSCYRVRGSVVTPRVFIDDAPALAGVDMLASVPREDINRVEIIRGGTVIRVYTDQFMEWAARNNYRPRQLAF